MNDSDNRTRALPGRLTLTAGPGADLEGTDDRVLQAGADYLARLGGGILQISPGTYQMRNALYLHANLTIRGSGPDTVLRKTAGASTPLTRETDWYEFGINVEDTSLFQPGCGIMLRSYSESGALQDVVRDTVVGVNGHDITLSRRPEKNFWPGACDTVPTAATLFPILTAAEGVCDVVVEDLVLDGNREHNEEINGNYAGAVFLQQCHRFTFRRVTARHYNGDGFSFQICDDVHFEECQSLDNANLGFHPGSGSQRPVFQRCTARGNSQGVFFCWGVTHGRVEEVDCSDNRDFGISIGHRDTDNRIHNTRFAGNHRVGLLFRKSENDFRGAHRNRVENCHFIDNGFAEDGVGIDFQGAAHDVEIRDCRFEDSGQARQRIGIRLSAEAHGTRLAGNTFGGLERDVVHPDDTLSP
ncbi:MAG: right-handed parallel beta-helix repeat-containing protein [Candidatus Latescibacterota bacterium]